MLQRKRGLCALLGGACMFVLTGCSGPADVVLPTATSTLAPTFDSEEEARVAADIAYANYFAATNRAGQSGGVDTSMLPATSTQEWLAHETDFFVGIVQMGRTQQGDATYDRLVLQQVTETKNSVFVTVYACMDLSQVVTVDTSTGGNPLRPEALPMPVEVSLESSAEARNKLLVSSQSQWLGENFCQS